MTPPVPTETEVLRITQAMLQELSVDAGGDRHPIVPKVVRDAVDLLSRLWEAHKAGEADKSSLRMALDAERHVHEKDNEYLLVRAEAAEARLGEARKPRRPNGAKDRRIRKLEASLIGARVAIQVAAPVLARFGDKPVSDDEAWGAYTHCVSWLSQQDKSDHAQG